MKDEKLTPEKIKALTHELWAEMKPMDITFFVDHPLQSPDAEHISELIKAGADKDAEDDDGKTPLHVAVQHDYTAAVQALIDAGANKEVTTEWGHTLLHFASGSGYSETAQALIDAGAELEAKDEDGQTALNFAAEYAQTAAVQALLAAGADISTINQENIPPDMQTLVTTNIPADGQLPLMAALSAENKNEAEILRLVQEHSIITTDMLKELSDNSENHSLEIIQTILSAAALENCFYGKSAREPVDYIIKIHAKADKYPEERNAEKEAIHRATNQAIAQQIGIFNKRRVGLGVNGATHDMLYAYGMLQESSINPPSDLRDNIILMLSSNLARVNNQDQDGNTLLSLALSLGIYDPDILNPMINYPDIDLALKDKEDNTSAGYAIANYMVVLTIAPDTEKQKTMREVINTMAEKDEQAVVEALMSFSKAPGGGLITKTQEGNYVIEQNLIDNYPPLHAIIAPKIAALNNHRVDRRNHIAQTVAGLTPKERALVVQRASSEAAHLAQARRASNSQPEKGKAPEKQDPEKQSDNGAGGGYSAGGGKSSQ